MTLDNIKKGILSNLAVKNRYTLEVNHVIEGNSYFGVCIFVGVSAMFGFEDSEVEDYLSIDSSERDFMHAKFLDIIEQYYSNKEGSTTAKRFHTKVNLILNHLYTITRKKVTLADIIKDKIK